MVTFRIVPSPLVKLALEYYHSSQDGFWQTAQGLVMSQTPEAGFKKLFVRKLMSLGGMSES